ncbi:MAG: hypothetical protein Q4B61_13850 [Bacteroidales bacterium]|nr:hypothetical protein [Bacteroidales bacterium]
MDYTDEEFYMLALSLMDEFTAYQKIKMLEERVVLKPFFWILERRNSIHTTVDSNYKMSSKMPIWSAN